MILMHMLSIYLLLLKSAAKCRHRHKSYDTFSADAAQKCKNTVEDLCFVIFFFDFMTQKIDKISIKETEKTPKVDKNKKTVLFFLQ